MNTPSRARKPATRRSHSAAFKRKLLRLCQQPGASVAAIALAHGINANLLFKWRREGGARSPQTLANVPVLLPITVDGVVAPEGRSGPLRGTCGGTIELKLGSARLRLHGAVDVPSLLALVRVLREAS